MQSPVYIQQRILEGEHQTQDFKFGITDSRKIARTLSAFANTDGGRLLVGIKDNGAVAGVRSEEEYYMIEAASQLHTRPVVPFEVREWNEGGKTVLEIIVEKGNQIPYMAADTDSRYQAFIRVNDRNYVANAVQRQIWKRMDSYNGAYVELSEAETTILHFLRQYEKAGMNKLIKLTGLQRYKLIDILVNLILMKVVEMEYTEAGVYYSLSTPGYDF